MKEQKLKRLKKRHQQVIDVKGAAEEDNHHHEDCDLTNEVSTESPPKGMEAENYREKLKQNLLSKIENDDIENKSE